jgi:hypothetical protein
LSRRRGRLAALRKGSDGNSKKAKKSDQPPGDVSEKRGYEAVLHGRSLADPHLNMACKVLLMESNFTG